MSIYSAKAEDLTKEQLVIILNKQTIVMLKLKEKLERAIAGLRFSLEVVKNIYCSGCEQDLGFTCEVCSLEKCLKETLTDLGENKNE